MSLPYFYSFLNVSEDHQTTLLCRLHENQTLPQMQSFIYLVREQDMVARKPATPVFWVKIQECQVNLNS